MSRSWTNSLLKAAVGLFAVTAFMALPAGCASKRCGPCAQSTAKKCGPGCTKPCCQKAEGKDCGSGCKKPCRQKA
jgi:hypothetical protein